MDDENKPRRLSILKAQKSRNPLSDIGVENDDENTTNTIKTPKRVSFASNNSVKPFVADPEKNTIWDLTYEETLEKSESSSSAKLLQEKEDLNITIIDDNELDLTPTVDVLQNNATIAGEQNSTFFTDVMDFTKVINDENVEIEMHRDFTEDIEFTEPVIFINEQPENNEISMEQTEMVPASIVLNPQNRSSTNENILLPLESQNTINTTLDDTQQLINYNVSNKKKSDFSQVMSGETMPSFPNLSNLPLRGINSTSFIQNCSRVNTYPEYNEEEQVNLNESNDSVLQFQKLSLRETCLGNISDTSSLEITMAQSPTQKNCHLESTPSFLDRLEPFDFTIINKLKATRKEKESYYKKCNEELKAFLEKYNAYLKHQSEEEKQIETLKQELYNARERIKNKLEDFKKLMSGTTKVCENVSEPKTLSWTEKILNLSKESEEYWSIISQDDNCYRFSTLYETIELFAKVNEENGKVLNLEVKSEISEKSEPIALYMHRIFMDKLTPTSLASALGKDFDVLFLLDYVKITMENIVKIDKEFSPLQIKYFVKMDRDFRITFALISVDLIFTWRFSIDASDVNNINAKSVTYFAEVGKLRESEIKKCMNKCSNGFSFVKEFIEGLYQLKDQWEKRGEN